MQATSTDIGQSARLKAFWERLAQRYPMPFDEKTLADTEKVISLVKNQGVSIQGATILDVGCGTGIYTLPLAREAALVTGIDDSQTMLERLEDLIASRGTQNVRIVKDSWKDFDISAHGFAKAFDIAWISMSPAVRSLDDFQAMESCAKKWCVYIGWGRKRENPLMAEVFKAHGLELGPPPGVRAAFDLLSKSGRSPSLDFFETSWDWEGPPGEAVEDISCHIEMRGGEPQPDLITEVLAPHESNGLISHTTYVEEGLMVWPVP